MTSARTDEGYPITGAKHNYNMCSMGHMGERTATMWTSCVKAPWDFLASLFCGVIGYEIAAKIELEGRKGGGEVLAIIPFVRPSTPHTLSRSPKPPLPFPSGNEYYVDRVNETDGQ